MSNTEKVETRGAPRGKRPPMDLPSGLPRFLAREQVIDITGLCYATIWKMMQKGQFPRGRQIGANRVGWIQDEVLEWCNSRPVAPIKGDNERRA